MVGEYMSDLINEEAHAGLAELRQNQGDHYSFRKGNAKDLWR